MNLVKFFCFHAQFGRESTGKNLRVPSGFGCCCFIVIYMTANLPADAYERREALVSNNVNRQPFLQQNSLRLGGWISAGISYSTDNPDHHSAAPVTFNDRVNEFHLDQLNLFTQKLIDSDPNFWGWGGRIEVMFGTNARFTQATGFEDHLISKNTFRFYDAALPQAFVELYIPYGNGFKAKIGHFYTIIGYEAVSAPDNFFYSHAYTMHYGEPFTHTGALFNFEAEHNFSIDIGAVNCWDNFNENFESWNFIGRIAWSSRNKTSSAVISVITGDVKDAQNQNRTLYSLVFTYNFSDTWHYVLQHDYGFQQQAITSNDSVSWYGVSQYVFYDLSETIVGGIRAEWFRDDGDSRLNIGASGNYFEITMGVNWSPAPWVRVRPEIRYDWVDSSANAFDHQSKKNQLLFSMDIVLSL